MLAEEAAVVTLLAPEAALVPVAEPRRSGRVRKTAMTATTMVAVARRTVPNDVVMGEETAVVDVTTSKGALEAESTVDDVGNLFTLIELVRRGDSVSVEEVKAFIDFIREYIRVVVLGGMPFSNAVVAEDYADGFGYQVKHERGTMQNETIAKIINESSDQVGVFLREKLDSVKEAFGAEIDNSFLNLNRGQKKKSWHSDKLKEELSGQCITHYLQCGKQGALLLRPYRNEDLVVRVNIPHGCEHMHCIQGASVSWVMDLKLDIEKIESSTCSAIESASRIQDAMHLDLEGRYGDVIWDSTHFTGSASRTPYIKPRECTVVTSKEGQLLLFCSRIASLTNGFKRDGVSLEDIIGPQEGLTVQALERCSHTGGFRVGKMRVFLFKHFAGLGFTSEQLAARIDADPEAKELLIE